VSTLVVQPEQIARRLGLPQPLDERDRWLIEQAITDAQADLEAYLGRPITAQTYTETGMLPVNGQYVLTYWPVIAITSTTAETDSDTGAPTGLYTVVYTAGLDGVTDPELEPLRRFVRTHTLYSETVQGVLRRLMPESARKVASLGVEGQNVTYADVYTVAGNATELGLPGALPTFKSCDRWRLAGRRVVQPLTRAAESWPYETTYNSGWWGC
jgi:hypothetical protein